MSLADEIAELTAEVTNQTTITQSVVTLLTSLNAQLVDLKNQLANAGVAPEQLAAVQTMIDTIKANDATLAKAVEANTSSGVGSAPAAA